MEENYFEDRPTYHKLTKEEQEEIDEFWIAWHNLTFEQISLSAAITESKE